MQTQPTHTINRKAARGLYIFLLAASTSLPGCKKLVTIGEPLNSLTATEVFSSDTLAYSALAAVYSQMINSAIFSHFANGLSTLAGGYSADEFNCTYQGYYRYSTNSLFADSATAPIWQSAYTTIYNANAVIEGIAASASANLHDSVRRQLTAEAKFVRALSYFYLVNFYGDVPLALTIDFNKTAGMTRTSKAQVYQQIIGDLKDAQAGLAADYSQSGGVRNRPNKMAAAGLLARVYLFTGDYADAAAQAGSVIGNSSLYGLENDLNNVFLTTSREAIWQLQQNANSVYVGNATPEGTLFLPVPLNSGPSAFVYLTDQLMNAFETGDQRRAAWVDSSFNNNTGTSTGYFFFPYKYKVGRPNYSIGGSVTEYYMVLRLAEQYLIRAEAEANGAPGGPAAAIQDLNILRTRAGLPGLSANLTSDQLLAAVAHERQIELFAEWGHRWLDLKRTGKAHDALSQIAYKQPWKGDYQLLYPIPPTEIQADPALLQNPGY